MYYTISYCERTFCWFPLTHSCMCFLIIPDKSPYCLATESLIQLILRVILGLEFLNSLHPRQYYTASRHTFFLTEVSIIFIHTHLNRNYQTCSYNLCQTLVSNCIFMITFHEDRPSCVKEN